MPKSGPQGIGVLAQAVSANQRFAQRRQHARRRWKWILVGVELDKVVPGGLLPGNVAGHGADIRAQVFDHDRQLRFGKTTRAGAMLSRPLCKIVGQSLPPRKHARPANLACFRGGFDLIPRLQMIRESMAPKQWVTMINKLRLHRQSFWLSRFGPTFLAPGIRAPVGPILQAPVDAGRVTGQAFLVCQDAHVVGDTLQARLRKG